MGTSLIVTAAALLVAMLSTWALSLRLRDVSIVDVAWGPAFALVAWCAYAVDPGSVLAPLLVTAWGLRLGAHIGARKRRENREDPRYAAWRERHGDRFPLVSLFTVFGFQGLLVWIVSLPVQAAATSGDALGALSVAGVALWAIGLGFEAVGDAQLAAFKRDPANRGKVMDRGLWRYTRHPNYFGDCTLWWGLYLLAVDAGAWWTLPAPLIMTLLLTRVSGKDHLEKSMSKRPGYAEYVERTSGFVPLPPRGAGR